MCFFILGGWVLKFIVLFVAFSKNIAFGGTRKERGRFTDAYVNPRREASATRRFVREDVSSGGGGQQTRAVLKMRRERY